MTTTNPSGRVFISYRRSPARPYGNEEAQLLLSALRDRGIPTWRDIDDLGPVPTEEELAQTLNDPETAGAVMLIAPELATSDVVKFVEAPLILDRFRKRDGFIIKPVLIGVGYDDVDRILERPGSLEELGSFNLERIKSGQLGEEDARRIACEVLKQRLGAIRQNYGDTPFLVGLFSRRSAGMSGYSLRHDFTSYFDGRAAVRGAYEHIEAALLDAASRLASTRDRVSLIARGNAALPLGVLYGSVFSPFVFDLTWRQGLPGMPEEDWSLNSGRSEVELSIEFTRGAPASEDLVLTLSINADIRRAVGEYLAHANLKPRATISVGLGNGPLKQGQALSAKDGVSITYSAIDSLRQKLSELHMRRASIHIFLACPLALAVLLGQKLNTFTKCTVYEHLPHEVPSYHPVHTFKPSDMNYQVK